MYQARGKRCGVLEGLGFKTEPEMPLEMLRVVVARGQLPSGDPVWVVFRRSTGFRPGVEGSLEQCAD